MYIYLYLFSFIVARWYLIFVTQGDHMSINDVCLILF